MANKIEVRAHQENRESRSPVIGNNGECSPRPKFGNVCALTEIIIVERNQDTVFGSLKVKFQTVHTHLTR